LVALGRGCVKTSLRRFKTALPWSSSVKESSSGLFVVFRFWVQLCVTMSALLSLKVR
jgi:hypothetical protein